MDQLDDTTLVVFCFFLLHTFWDSVQDCGILLLRLIDRIMLCELKTRDFSANVGFAQNNRGQQQNTTTSTFQYSYWLIGIQQICLCVCFFFYFTRDRKKHSSQNKSGTWIKVKAAYSHSQTVPLCTYLSWQFMMMWFHYTTLVYTETAHSECTAFVFAVLCIYHNSAAV